MVKKILYVEDNSDIADVVKLFLEKEGYDVVISYTGKEALSKLEKTNFDLVLLDIMLPDINGIDLFDLIVKIKKYPTKFVFLSIINVTSKEKEELTNKGVSDYISKPFEKEDLINRIKKVFNEKR